MFITPIKLMLNLGIFVALSTSLRAEVFPLPPADVDVIGAVTTVRATAADTFVDIARRHGLGYNDMVRANPDVDPWLPGEGTQIMLPTQFVLPDAPRRGVVLNLPEYRLYYFLPAKGKAPARVMTFPISIGRMDWETPLGKTRVVAKSERPSWYPPESIRKEHAEAGDPLPRVVPPGPDNPLGDYALRLGLPGYLIHGTNRPAGVGMRVTHGCIRMFPEDIAVFFASLPVGTPVRIVNQPVKLGWLNDALYVEAHVPLGMPATVAPASDGVADANAVAGADADSIAPPDTNLAELDELADGEVDLTLMMRAFVAATRERQADADWQRMEAAVFAGLGVPVAVGVEVQTVSVTQSSD
ncbi:MAG: L,D-transpeptidase family protein [Pseudomonadota bacterium]